MAEGIFAPTWKYHATLPARLIESQEALDALGPGWEDTPAAHGVITAPSAEQLVALPQTPPAPLTPSGGLDYTALTDLLERMLRLEPLLAALQAEQDATQTRLTALESALAALPELHDALTTRLTALETSTTQPAAEPRPRR
jgi:hypothetical protein